MPSGESVNYFMPDGSGILIYEMSFWDSAAEVTGERWAFHDRASRMEGSLRPAV